MSRIGSRGFTLIEVMIAVSILAVGTIGILRAYTTALSGLGASRASIDIVCLLKEKMGGIERDMIEKKDLFGGTYEGQFEGKYEAFGWRLDVRTLDLGSEEMNNCLNELELAVYDNGVKPPRSFSLVTYMESNAPSKK